MHPCIAGMLHLLGYDHETEEDWQEMTSMEDKIIEKYKKALQADDSSKTSENHESPGGVEKSKPKRKGGKAKSDSNSNAGVVKAKVASIEHCKS